MPLKTSKKHKNLLFQKKEEHVCDRNQLFKLAAQWGKSLFSKGDWIFLEGPMGAGKTTFAEGLLFGWGEEDFQGSPTFSIANEYSTPQARVIHMDFYRLESEEELEDAGIFAYFHEQKATLKVCEWGSRSPSLMQENNPNGRVWKVEISFNPKNEDQRNVGLYQRGSH